MTSLLATATGYGAERVYGHGESLTLAPDATPKLVLMAVLLVLLALWARAYLRSVERR